MAGKTLAFYAHNEDQEMTGYCTLTVRDDFSYVDVYVFNDGAELFDWTLSLDSIERQLPGALRALGFSDEQVAHDVKLAVEWAVEITGGESHRYDLHLGDVKVHTILYNDGLTFSFPMEVWHNDNNLNHAFGHYPVHAVDKIRHVPDVSYHVTGLDELDGFGFRRAMISRTGTSSHVVEWRVVETPVAAESDAAAE